MTNNILLELLPALVPFIFFGTYIVMSLVSILINTIVNYYNCNKLSIGDTVYTSDIYDYELGQSLPYNSSKVINIVYRKYGRNISYVELENNDKVDFIQYNTITQY